MSGRLSSEHSRSVSRSSQPQPQSQTQRFSQGQSGEVIHRRSISSRLSNPNVFADEYTLQPIPSEDSSRAHRSRSVSSVDSSRTSQTLHRATSIHRKDAPLPTTDANLVTDPFGDDARVSLEEMPRRSSLPQKGIEAPNRNAVASINDPSVAHRSQSVSSRFSIPPPSPQSLHWSNRSLSSICHVPAGRCGPFT